MINEELFKSILDTEDGGYIENGDTIPFGLIKLFSRYKSDKVKKLFVKNPDNFTINRFKCELKCRRCGKTIMKELSRTALLDCCKGGGLSICEECLKKEKEEALIRRNEELNNSYRRLEDNTDTYIERYLDPDRSWKEGVKTYIKINALQNILVDWKAIKEYIRSMDYYDFLSTPYWKAIAEKVKKKSDFRCQLCNSSENLNVHHRTYDNHGDELHHMEDLICICKKCHEKHHFD